MNEEKTLETVGDSSINLYTEHETYSHCVRRYCKYCCCSPCYVVNYCMEENNKFTCCCNYINNFADSFYRTFHIYFLMLFHRD